MQKNAKSFPNIISIWIQFRTCAWWCLNVPVITRIFYSVASMTRNRIKIYICLYIRRILNGINNGSCTLSLANYCGSRVLKNRDYQHSCDRWNAGFIVGLITRSYYLRYFSSGFSHTLNRVITETRAFALINIILIHIIILVQMSHRKEIRLHLIAYQTETRGAGKWGHVVYISKYLRDVNESAEREVPVIPES